MAQRRKAAHVNAGSLFHDLLYWGQVTRDDDRSLACLHPFIAGDAGFLHLRGHGARQAQSAGHQKSGERHHRALAIDDDIVKNQQRKAVRLFQLHCQRGNFPLSIERLLDVQHFIRIRSLVLLYETMKVRAERSAGTRRSRAFR